MKRKDINEANDDFFDFTLSSPALKIRRLDAEFAPLSNEDETPNPVTFNESTQFQDTVVEQLVESSPIAIDTVVEQSVNEEKAIVLFEPKNNTPSLHSALPFSISADSGFLSGFKNPVIWSNQSNGARLLGDEIQKQDGNSGQKNGCLAVVPWVHSHTQQPPEVEDPAAQMYETMDADAMDVEDDNNCQQVSNAEWGAVSVSQGLNQWQRHCMIQQPVSNLTTPITWFGRGA
ncbi:uncharacterized protein [Rutidosis leptorrhynchoides]|uniref:uncharacterized protein n=1 Tax=Rutidosis leptorrhynchoides TaxID=125765 RepID=UPI003A9948B9